jgi:hypothetical protein
MFVLRLLLVLIIHYLTGQRFLSLPANKALIQLCVVGPILFLLHFAHSEHHFANVRQAIGGGRQGDCHSAAVATGGGALRRGATSKGNARGAGVLGVEAGVRAKIATRMVPGGLAFSK